MCIYVHLYLRTESSNWWGYPNRNCAPVHWVFTNGGKLHITGRKYWGDFQFMENSWHCRDRIVFCCPIETWKTISVSYVTYVSMYITAIPTGNIWYLKHVTLEASSLLFATAFIMAWKDNECVNRWNLEANFAAYHLGERIFKLFCCLLVVRGVNVTARWNSTY